MSSVGYSSSAKEKREIFRIFVIIPGVADG